MSSILCLPIDRATLKPTMSSATTEKLKDTVIILAKKISPDKNDYMMNKQRNGEVNYIGDGRFQNNVFT